MSKFIKIGYTDCKKTDVKRFEYSPRGTTVYIYIVGKKEPESMNFKSHVRATLWVGEIKKDIES